MDNKVIEGPQYLGSAWPLHEPEIRSAPKLCSRSRYSYREFGRNDALSVQHLADVLMVALTIELRIGQHKPDGDPLVSRAHQRTQGSTVMGRAAPRRLRQDETPVEVHGHGPFQPVAPGKARRPIPPPLDEEGADGARG
jgi:hypothetical protein